MTASRVTFHEISHRLGIDDEYFDYEIYPSPNYGEDDSLMRSGMKLYPRHIENMLKPLKCLGRSTF